MEALKRRALTFIYTGLVTWSEKCDCLKKKHGKRLALRVNTKDFKRLLVNGRHSIVIAILKMKNTCCC